MPESGSIGLLPAANKTKYRIITAGFHPFEVWREGFAFPEQKEGENLMNTEETYRVGPIAGLPKSMRPYERCEEYGPESLSDEELLAVLLRSGPSGMSCMDVSAKLISTLGNGDGILFLRKTTFEELIRIHGIGRVKAVQLLCIGELARRMAKKEAKARLKLNSPESIADYYMEDLLSVTREQVLVMYLDTKYRLITDRVLSTGTVNASLISPREIFQEALKFDAVHIILLHNTRAEIPPLPGKTGRSPSGSEAPGPCSALILRITLFSEITAFTVLRSIGN